MARDHCDEIKLATTMFYAIADDISKSLTTYSSWLIGGFGAVLVVILVNLDSVSKFLPVPTVGWVAFLFLCAVSLQVFQRYLALIVGSAVAANRAANDEIPKLPLGMVGFNLQVFAEMAQDAVLPPMRWWARRAMARNLHDPTASAKTLMRFAQIQSLLVVGQMVLLLAAGFLVARRLISP